MKIKHYLLFLLALSFNTFAQSFIENGQIGSFRSAAGFSINSSGMIYVCDSESNEIYKIDTLGTVIKVVGGYGWDAGSFDTPVDIYANVLNVYVADKNNNRIQMLDKDLNYLSQFTTQNSTEERNSFKYPTSVVISNQGDYYILDSDNKRVLKYDSRGNFQNSIGSIDAGNYQLTDPRKIALDDFGNLVVLENNSIFIFDQFGNGLFKMNLPFSAENINSFFGTLILVDKSSLMVINVKGSNEYVIKISPQKINIDEEITDAAIFNSKFYVLTKKSIHIFNLIGN